MTKVSYSTATCLIALALSINPSIAHAEGCTVVPTCSELGYTETDCGGNPALKCPFDQTKLFCGSNTSGSEGGSSGSSNTPSCNVADIYYSDDTCSATVISGKTPIGVVVDPAYRLIMWLGNPPDIKWTTGSSQTVPGISMDWGDDLSGERNTDTILAYAQSNGTEFPIAQYCHDLTTGGRKWYLPAYAELRFVNQRKQRLQETYSKFNITWSGNFASSSQTSSGDRTWYDNLNSRMNSGDTGYWGTAMCFSKY